MRTLEQHAPGPRRRPHDQPGAGGTMPRPHRRSERRRRARVHQGARRAGTRDGGCDGRVASRPARTQSLCRHSRQPEGPVRYRRRSHARRLARAGRCAAGHRACTGRAAYAGRPLRAGGPHQHDRVRLLRSRHQSPLRHAVLPLGSCDTTYPRRQFLGHRSVGIRRYGGRRIGHRHRRLLPDYGGRSAALSATSPPRDACRSPECCH